MRDPIKKYIYPYSHIPMFADEEVRQLEKDYFTRYEKSINQEVIIKMLEDSDKRIQKRVDALKAENKKLREIFQGVMKRGSCDYDEAEYLMYVDAVDFQKALELLKEIEG